MTLEQLRRYAQRLKVIAARHGVKDIFVFGSVARGSSTASSDIDFLIEMEEGTSALGVGGFQYEVQQLLGVQVDVVPTFALPKVQDKAFIESIQADARSL